MLFAPNIAAAMVFSRKDMLKTIACSVSFGITVDVIVYIFETTVTKEL